MIRLFTKAAWACGNHRPGWMLQPQVDDAHLFLSPQEQIIAEKGVLKPDAAKSMSSNRSPPHGQLQVALQEMISYYQSTGTR